MNLYTSSKYLRYKLFSSHKRGHGIHSPFLFNLITKVFRNKTAGDIVLKIERIRKKLLTDERIIRVTDYGTGSGRRGGNLRRVSEITRKSSVPAKYGRLLANLTAEYGRDCVIELGTSVGIGSMYLSAGAPGATVYTVEGCKEISAVAENNFKNGGFRNIHLISTTFNEAIEKLQGMKVVAGLVYIDGDHRKEKVLEYFEKICTICDQKSVMIFDDIHNSKGMGEAWKKISSDSRVTLSIDLFRMGVIFFRKGLTPGSFRIRY